MGGLTGSRICAGGLPSFCAGVSMRKGRWVGVCILLGRMREVLVLVRARVDRERLPARQHDAAASAAGGWHRI